MTSIRAGSQTYRRGLLYPAAMLTAGAAAIHFSVVPDHVSEYPPFGILFLITALAQVAFAAATVLWPRRWVFAAAVLIALGCITVWLASRTVGLPFGPSEKLGVDTSVPASIFLQIATSNGQLAGTLASVIEAVSVLVFGVLLITPPHLRPQVTGGWPARSRAAYSSFSSPSVGSQPAVSTRFPRLST